MKTLKNLCVTILCLVLLGACEESLEEPSFADEQQIAIEEGKPGMRTIPFKAKFYTIRSYDDEAAGTLKCAENNDDYTAFNLQVGGGNATHLGKFTTTIWFCGSGLDYKNGEGVFIAANGDKLYFYAPSPGEVGEVKLFPNPSPNPPYEAYFMDPFSFNGGTGRFEGASGGGYTDSLVDLYDDDGNYIPEHRTDHKFVGTLTLKNGNL